MVTLDQKISGFPLDGLFLIMYKISVRRITLLSEGQTKQKIKQDKKQKTKQNKKSLLTLGQS